MSKSITMSMLKEVLGCAYDDAIGNIYYQNARVIEEGGNVQWRGRMWLVPDLNINFTPNEFWRLLKVEHMTVNSHGLIDVFLADIYPERS